MYEKLVGKWRQSQRMLLQLSHAEPSRMPQTKLFSSFPPEHYYIHRVHWLALCERGFVKVPVPGSVSKCLEANTRLHLNAHLCGRQLQVVLTFCLIALKKSSYCISWFHRSRCKNLCRQIAITCETAIGVY